MKIELAIEKLASYIEEYNNKKLSNNQEVDISTFGISVPTPSGYKNVNSFIKKFSLPMMTIEFDNAYVIRVAENHILQKDGNNIFAKELTAGSTVDHKDGSITVTKITRSENEDCFDISIDAPHLYYDYNGLIHHNTLITAVLSNKVEPYGRSIVIVPNKSLVTQTEADYINLGLDVGVYFGDRKEWGKTHTICTWQSLNSLFKKSKKDLDSIENFIDGVVAVIVDEVHVLKAEVLKSLLTGVMANIPIRWGLTGTIPKEKLEFTSLQVSIGNVINRIAASDLQDKGVLANCHVNIIQTQETQVYKTYQSEQSFLTSDTARLDWLAKEIGDIRLSGNTLVLVDRISTGKLLESKIKDAVFISGSTKSKDRKDQYDEVDLSEDKVIIATYGVASTGLNIIRLHNLVLLEPGKSFVRVIQSIGRGLRKGFDKDFVHIWDIASRCKFSSRHLAKRKAFYRDAKYEFTLKKIDYRI